MDRLPTCEDLRLTQVGSSLPRAVEIRGRVGELRNRKQLTHQPLSRRIAFSIVLGPSSVATMLWLIASLLALQSYVAAQQTNFDPGTGTRSLWVSSRNRVWAEEGG